MLNKQQLKYLRSLAHERKAIIWIGQNGLGDNVIDEINSTLDHHELVKIKLHLGDRQKRDLTIEQVCLKTGAELVQKIGNTITVFRKNAETPVIQLPA